MNRTNDVRVLRESNAQIQEISENNEIIENNEIPEINEITENNLNRLSESSERPGEEPAIRLEASGTQINPAMPVNVSREIYDGIHHRLLSIEQFYSNQQMPNEQKYGPPREVVQRRAASNHHERFRPYQAPEVFSSIPDWRRNTNVRSFNNVQVLSRSPAGSSSSGASVSGALLSGASSSGASSSEASSSDASLSSGATSLLTHSKNRQIAYVRPVSLDQQTQTDLYTPAYSSIVERLAIFERNVFAGIGTMATIRCDLNRRITKLNADLETIQRHRRYPPDSPRRHESTHNDNVMVTPRHICDQNSVITHACSSGAISQSNQVNQLNKSVLEPLPIDNRGDNEMNDYCNQSDDTKSLSPNISTHRSSQPEIISTSDQLPSDVSFARPIVVVRTSADGSSSSGNSFLADHSFDSSSSVSLCELSASSSAAPSLVSQSQVGNSPIGHSSIGHSSIGHSSFKQKSTTSKTSERKFDECDLTNETAYVIIGENGTKIPKIIFDQMRWDSPTYATQKLLITLFPRTVLASHSLTGKQSRGII